MRFQVYKSIVTLLSFVFLVGTSSAQEIDENTINKLVQKEIERILNSEIFDAAVARGIQTFINDQRQAEQQAQNRQQLDRVKDMRPVDLDVDHILGSIDAPITLVEYSDFECPFCKRFHPTVVQLLENNPDKLRWVYRHFPLGFHNPGAQKQSEASECVAELSGNDTFWQYIDLIYQRTTSNGKGFPLKNLQPLAEEIGVDGDAFAECLKSERMVERVQQDIDNGVTIGVSGTPMAVISNEKGEARVIAGALPLSELQSIVDALIHSASAE